MVLPPEVISDHNLITKPLPLPKVWGNVLSNDLSSRTSASLSPRNGGVFYAGFYCTRQSDPFEQETKGFVQHVRSKNRSLLKPPTVIDQNVLE